jgi:hypothetical protein
VAAGETVAWLPLTAPTLLTDRDVAPLTDHERTDELPLVMLEGEAEKEEMRGRFPWPP